MLNSHAQFAQTVAGIRQSLYGIADAMEARADHEAILKAAACLSFFESDLLTKAAGPVLPGES
jgi:hypothetical protein